MLSNAEIGGNIYAIIINTLCSINNLFFLIYILNHLVSAKSQKNSDSTSKRVLYLTITAIIVYTIQSVAAIFDPIYKLQENEEAASNISILGGLMYAIGKYLVYVLFIIRLNYIFQDSLVPYSQTTIRSVYGLLFAQFVFLMLALIGFSSDEKDEDASSIDNIVFLGGVSIYFILDIIFCFLLPYLFIRKLYELIPSKMRLYGQEKESDQQNKHLTSPSNHDAHDQNQNKADSVNNSDNNNNNNNMTAHIELSTHPAESSINNSSHPQEPSNNNNNSTTQTSVLSIQSLPDLGITSANAPIHQDPSQHKYVALLNTASRLTLLATFCLISSISMLFLFAIFLMGSDDNSPGQSFAESCFKIDGAINVTCIALCFTWSDPLYYRLCSSCHGYFQQKKCCSCLFKNQ